MGAGKHQARMYWLVVWVLENIKPKWKLESRVAQAGLRYFGHEREERGMENDVVIGAMSGKRGRGRSWTRWLDNVKHIKGPSINIQYEMGRQISSQMGKCYRGCRQGSDTTRQHDVTRWIILTYWCGSNVFSNNPSDEILRITRQSGESLPNRVNVDIITTSKGSDVSFLFQF